MFMNKTESTLFETIKNKELDIQEPTWEACRKWLSDHDWKVNVLSDYPQGEVKFTVRKGFERIEMMGQSDLEVLFKAILEIHRRDVIDQGELTEPDFEQ
ncbi:MAG: hypothetical protein KDD48_03760 [Bdellovibrionales bacterium]|nr:hypothetical protein [Bdellovibrionales bacterium]